MLSKFYGRLFDTNTAITLALDVLSLMLVAVMAVSLRYSAFNMYAIIGVLFLHFLPIIVSCHNDRRGAGIVGNLVLFEKLPDDKMIQAVNDARQAIFWTAINVVAKLTAVGLLASGVYLFLTFEINAVDAVEITLVGLTVTYIGSLLQWRQGSPKLAPCEL